MSTHLTNVAIVGGAGQVGSHVLSALLSSPTTFNITLLTRPDSSSELPSDPKINIARADYADVSAVASALKSSNTQILIISLSVMSPPETQKSLIDAAAASGTVKYIIPNEWGTDWTNPSVNADVMIGGPIVANREYINSKNLSWISVSCGFWYEYSLAAGPSCYGFDLRSVPGKAYLYDGGNAPVNTSTWKHTGEGVAAMFSLPISASDAGPNGLSIDGTFANSFLRLSSFQLTQRDMLASLCRVTSTKESDWDAQTISSADYIAKGREELQTGNRAGFGKVLYARVMQAEKGVNEGFSQAYQAHKGLHDEALGLGREDLDEATGRAVEMARSNIEKGMYWG